LGGDGKESGAELKKRKTEGRERHKAETHVIWRKGSSLSEKEVLLRRKWREHLEGEI